MSSSFYRIGFLTANMFTAKHEQGVMTNRERPRKIYEPNRLENRLVG